MIKKKLKTHVFALGLALGSMGVAQAAPAVWTDLYDPADFLVTAGSLPVSYTHNLTDAASGGFRPGIDTITSATLTFWLYDDALLGDSKWGGDSQEGVSFNFDGTGWTASQNVDGFGFDLGWLDDIFEQTISFNSLGLLSADGFLNVALKATSGDFVFDKSKLVAYGETTRVPEPATVTLLGVGLLGFMLTQRRRRQRGF